MKAFLFIILMHLFPISVIAQRQHVIEPAILEVRYDCWQAEHDDSYILRVGKTANQFFSFFQNNEKDSPARVLGGKRQKFR